ncbi:NirD/YgiW/YdeI family stress tolerance protein, partial [Acinetobacter baumannii]
MKMLKVILMTAGMATAGVVVANTPVNQAAIAPATVTT